MKPRTLAAPERLERRDTMDADIHTIELLPSAHGTAEASSEQWQDIVAATHANVIHRFENDQAGEERHVWSGEYHGWEGIAEFNPSLPEGAVIDAAVLRVVIVNTEDTMHRQPSLVAHVSSQDQEGDIVISEYNNAGAAVGSVPFAAMTPGTSVDIPLDASAIPTTGAISLSLRTSDLAAGTQPTSDQDARSVITYSGMKLELRYHTPAQDAKTHDIVLPGELQDLLAEAIALSQNGPEWRTPETGEVVASALRKGLHVNLRGAEAPVVGLHARVTANGVAVTASVYRGTTLLATLPVPADGRFTYSYDNGFTDVLFTTATVATVTSTEMKITTDETMQPITGEAVGIMTSKPYALAAAPTVPVPNNVAFVAGTLRFTTSPGIRGTDNRRYIMRDPSLFTLIQINASGGGSGRITTVGTIKKEGVDHRGREYGSTSGFPEGYVRWITEGVVAIAPGAPAPISFIASGSGTFSFSEANTLEELLPPARMTAATMNTDLMKMNNQFEAAGIFAPYTEIREGSSPTFSFPGDIANVQYHIRNKALAGGPVTARVYAGWYAGEPTRGALQGTFSLSMGGLQTQRVSANVTAPAKPADATSDRPIIAMVLTLPNGTTVQNAKLGKEPISHEKRIYTKNSDNTTTMHIESGEYTRREQARIHALTDRALKALLSSNDSRLIAARTALGADHIVELIAKNTAAALAGTDNSAIDHVMALLDAGMEHDIDDVFRDREGVGGSENVAPSTEKLLARGSNTRSAAIISAAESIGLRTPGSIYTEAMSWTIPVSHPLQEEFLAFDLTTIAGRLLGRGIMRMHDDLGNESAQWQTAFMIQTITDIPASMLIDVANAGSDIAVARNFKALMEKAQYAHIALPAAGPSTPAIVMAAPNKQRYDNGDTDIRIRFDVGATASGVKSVQVFNGTIPVGGARSIGFVTVPIMSIPSLVPPTTGPLPEFVECNLTIKIVLEDGTVLQRTIDRFEMDIHLPDVLRDPPNALPNNEVTSVLNLSSLPDTPEHVDERRKENFVLSILANPQKFPLREPLISSGSWYWNIASAYHDGSNQYNAVDITMPGTTDHGKPVFAPTRGKVITGGTGTNDWHAVVLEHESVLPTGENFVWYTKYLHMDNIGVRDANGNMISLSEGMIIEANTKFGEVSWIGAGEGNDHMHMSGHIGSANAPSIDMRKVLIDIYGLVAKAEDAGADRNQEAYRDNMSFIVEWDENVNAFVTSATQNSGITNPRLILDRSAQNTSENVPASESNQYWIAYHEDPTQRKRVVSTIVNNVRKPDGIIGSVELWVSLDEIDNPIQYWNAELQIFTMIPR